MIQLNLLPDIKLQYIKAERNKRLIVASSALVSIVAIVALIGLSFAVFVIQKKHMNDLSSDIAGYSRNLNATTDINKILTIQNQLTSLSSLHQKKPDTTRILPFINQLTPSEVSMTALAIDYDTSAMTITGTSSSKGKNKLADVNKFVDTLKFTDYSVRGGESSRAFKSVVLSNFGRSTDSASYSITLLFDPILFDNTQDVTLKVPTQITTRSETEKPAALFESIPSTSKEQ